MVVLMTQYIEVRIMLSKKAFEARRAHWLNTYKQDQMRKLDAQGRHRSEWCYAAYDGRLKNKTI